MIEMNWKSREEAFTLTELLMVVAVIGILAVIAIPCFLNAQIRAKVSTAKTELRTLATGLETYCVDQNGFPRGNWYQLSTRFSALGADRGLILLSTPIAYIREALMLDEFPTELRDGSFVAPSPELDDDDERHWYKYSSCDCRGSIIGTFGKPDYDRRQLRPDWYILQSSGPDHTRHTLGQGALRIAPDNFRSTVYDPTNGLTSRGSLYRAGGSPTGVGSTIFAIIGSAN